jgi:hypothetical protein
MIIMGTRPRVNSHSASQTTLLSLLESTAAKSAPLLLAEMWPITAFEMTWEEQTSNKVLKWKCPCSIEFKHMHRCKFVKIKSFQYKNNNMHRGSKIQTPASRSFHARCQCLKITLFWDLTLHLCWRRGCTRWMESAWHCSFSWTPSHLGADSS